jgi:outer membrane protein TolC
VRAVLPTVLVVVFLIVSISPVGAQISTIQAPAAPRTSAPQGPAAPRSNNPFLGGVPTGELTRDALSLSITEVINRALAYNLGVLLAENGVSHAQGTRQRVLSEMLPNITGRVSESRQVVNLAAFGFPLPAGIPSIVGPFNLFDARVYLSQSVLDFKAMNDAKAESHNIAAAQYDYKTARDLVVLVATVSYAQALAASARVDATEGQVETSQALLNQASDLKANGLVAGIEVLRAEVQLDTDRQRVTAAKNEFEKSKLQLARLIGLPIGQTFTLANQLTQVAIPDMTLEAALDRAYKTRPDYLAALQRVLAAEAKRQAASGEMKPAIRVTANFGDLGLSIADSHSTYAVTGAVEVPIFQGNRARGRLLEADAELRDRRADADDLKGGIYYEVRTAMLDLDSGNEQLEVAARARELAATQLTQARDRFAAGVASNIEVVQAQGAVTLANDQYISALYATSLAKGALVRAVGIAEETARQLFGVSR